MSVPESIRQGFDEIQGWQADLYRTLHQNPELSMQERETAAEITSRLQSYRYDVQQIGGGVVGVLANGDGPTVLFRADIDGLPVKESTGLPYASTKTATDADGNTVPVVHACGHVPDGRGDRRQPAGRDEGQHHPAGRDALDQYPRL